MKGAFTARTLLVLLLFSSHLFALKQVTLSSGGDLQAAITAAATWQDNAICEEYVIVLDAGSSFAGSFNIPNKGCAKYVRLRSSRLSELPADTRVAPSQTPLMATITNNSPTDPTILTSDGAGYWAFEGLQIQTTSTPHNVIRLGTGVEDTEGKLPHHFIFDRVYGHGVAGLDGPVRIFYLNGRHLEITNSDLREAKRGGSDAQAIFCAQCLGPVLIKNNLLSATGESFMSGGGGCMRDGNFANTQCIFVPGESQSRIRVISNHLWKDPAWSVDTFNSGVPTRSCLPGEYYQDQSGGQWYRCTNTAGTWVTDSVPIAYTLNYAIKSTLEIREARNVEVYGNVLQNTWYGTASPNHYAFSLNQNGNFTPNYDIQDIRIWGNRAINTIGMLSLGNMISAYPGYANGGVTRTRRVTVEHNVFDRAATASSVKIPFPGSSAINGLSFPGPDDPGRPEIGMESLIFRHNTHYSAASGGNYSLLQTVGGLYPQLYGTNAINDNIFSEPTTPHAFLFSGQSSNHCTWLYGVPRPGAMTEIAKNAIAGSTSIGSSCATTPFYSGDTWPVDTANAPSITDMLADPAGGDFAIKTSFTAGLGTATDGSDLGADWGVVAAATAGAVSGAANSFLDFKLRGELPTLSGVTIQFTAPSTNACTAVVSDGPALTSPVGTPDVARVGKSGTVTLTGLTSGARYYYGITCAGVRLRGEFRTAPSPCHTTAQQLNNRISTGSLPIPIQAPLPNPGQKYCDPTFGTEVLRLSDNEYTSNSIAVLGQAAFSKYSTRVATVTNGGTVRIYTLDPQTLIAEPGIDLYPIVSATNGTLLSLNTVALFWSFSGDSDAADTLLFASGMSIYKVNVAVKVGANYVAHKIADLSNLISGNSPASNPNNYGVPALQRCTAASDTMTFGCSILIARPDGTYPRIGYIVANLLSHSATSPATNWTVKAKFINGIDSGAINEYQSVTLTGSDNQSYTYVLTSLYEPGIGEQGGYKPWVDRSGNFYIFPAWSANGLASQYNTSVILDFAEAALGHQPFRFLQAGGHGDPGYGTFVGETSAYGACPTCMKRWDLGSLTSDPVVTANNGTPLTSVLGYNSGRQYNTNVNSTSNTTVVVLACAIGGCPGTPDPYIGDVFALGITGYQQTTRLARLYHYLVSDQYTELQPMMSLDGKLVAYTSNYGDLSGRSYVFITRVPQ